VSRILVTGGGGFIGSALVARLVRAGHEVRVLDDFSRGARHRLAEVAGEVECIAGDVRSTDTVVQAAAGVEEIHHLAYINGTQFFYSAPDLVLDVAVRGMINVIDACRTHCVHTLLLASSSEVYQTPTRTPTDETAPLVVPDPLNPRFSYGGGKIISELMAINYGRKDLERVLIFRPHNVYGPDMGFEHVIPQFCRRLHDAAQARPKGRIPFQIQGDGSQTRSFCHVDDLVDGVMIMRERGEHLGIYHIGTTEEISIAELAQRIATHAGHEIELISGPAPAGGTQRRCPDVTKLAALGYAPRVPLAKGLPPTVNWYFSQFGDPNR
jgi:nucleoside-diphosphate-sugar epimerase